MKLSKSLFFFITLSLGIISSQIYEILTRPIPNLDKDSFITSEVIHNSKTSLNYELLNEKFPLVKNNNEEIFVRVLGFRENLLPSKNPYIIEGLNNKVNEKTEIFLEVEVINNSNKPQYFTGYANNYNLVNLKRNEKNIRSWDWCGFGTSTYKLNPKESVKMKIQSYKFIIHSLDKEKLQIGYHYRKSNETDSKMYWSQKFVISDKVRTRIRETLLN